MSWEAVTDLVASVAILTGAALALVAAIGIIRFPEVLSRMHSGTKPQVLGLILMMIGLAAQLRDFDAAGLLLLIIMFQLFTSPVASHMLSRATFRSGQVQEGALVTDELTPMLEEGNGPRRSP